MIHAAGAILTVGVIAAGLYFCVPWLYGRWSRTMLGRCASRRRCVVVTLDDGPGRQMTSAVLDVLATGGVKAVFFLLGRNIRGNEDLVRRIRAQGHEIGSHSHDHLHAWKVAPWRAVADIRRGRKAIDDALDVKGGTYPFRPPHGKLNLITWIYLLATRTPIVYWTIDSGDTWIDRPRDPDRAGRLSRERKGGVILIHDFDRKAEEMHRYALEALRSSLDAARELHLPVVTYSQLMGARK